MDEVVKLLSIIFEKFWQSTEVFTDWKWRNGTPIFKKKKKKNLGNSQAEPASKAQNSIYSTTRTDDWGYKHHEVTPGQIAGPFQWVRNWLDGHCQRVVVNGLMSKQGPLMSGVPQGLESGLAQFSTLVGDMDSGIDSSFTRKAITGIEIDLDFVLCSTAHTTVTRPVQVLFPSPAFWNCFLPLSDA
ncbi:hypothetical protein HGM15179_009579 [Zosterops borbonicus]|uniref:Uncharacterized protein n=1 Tax=Zosterops borbonicus TaxID=364589 RepID=A0A8K1GH40_9PASS|nr:hypothetical protein HGM15179_009579 [Zosterops borbonicus]